MTEQNIAQTEEEQPACSRSAPHEKCIILSPVASVLEEAERKVKREGRGERAPVCRQQTAVSDSGGESAGNFVFFFSFLWNTVRTTARCAQQVRQLFIRLSGGEIPGVKEEFRRNNDLDLSWTCGHRCYLYVLTSPLTTAKKCLRCIFFLLAGMCL